MQCMNTHCPGALVQIPRDLEDTEEAEAKAQQPPSGVQLICAGLLCQHVTSAHQLVSCFRSKCLNGELNVLETATRAPENGGEGQEDGGVQVNMEDVAKGVETTGICAFIRCGTRHGRDYMSCVKNKCSASSQHQNVKRRVNNPMVGMVECTKQCSSSDDSSARLVCIKSCQTKK